MHPNTESCKANQRYFNFYDYPLISSAPLPTPMTVLNGSFDLHNSPSSSRGAAITSSCYNPSLSNFVSDTVTLAGTMPRRAYDNVNKVGHVRMYAFDKANAS